MERKADVLLERSDWRAAALQLDEIIFAIGDVHGCRDQLAMLLDTFTDLAAERPARLIFLGDLVCRGPESLGALALWAAPELARRFTRVHRLSGNHEQLLWLAISRKSVAQAAHDKWMTMGGTTFVDELRRATDRPQAPLTRQLLCDAAGSTVIAALDRLEHHVGIGNAIFVHGGLDPSVDAATALAAPFDVFGGHHWAWIQAPFLAWRGGFGGAMVVHGHTPPAKHRAMSGY